MHNRNLLLDTWRSLARATRASSEAPTDEIPPLVGAPARPWDFDQLPRLRD